ncbi:MAG: hypothetical protein RR582_06805 [Niameybacter sp.]
MRYYNSTKKHYMPIVGDEPNIIDDNSTEERKIEIECVRFFLNNKITKNVGDNFTIQHTSSDEKKLNSWFTAKTAKTVLGFTTFSTIKPSRTAPIEVMPLIISGSWEYDGQNERFKIPLLSPIYSTDKIKCKLSGKVSNKNVLTIDPNAGVIEVSREV